jgi:cupin 2 domain-containing protein
LKQNLFEGLPAELPEELFQLLATGRSFRLERIVSEGHSSTAGFWYDQPQHEWVVLLSGAARIEFADEKKSIELAPGDYLLIPAGCRHRVGWTSPEEKTVWLAIHFTE